MPNRLADALSPYLRQHADNPVDWQQWSDAALAEARRRDVPVFVSVGYAACHWCHVMADESFSDPIIAAALNQGFVCVKVDREERPDLDAVLMDACVALTGQGGWPLSVWLTPDGRPFYAGTYFPPAPRHGMPSFPQLLDALSSAWTNRRDEVLDSATAITDELARRAAAAPVEDGQPSTGDVEAALETLAGQVDPRHGGLGGAPKFPPSMVLRAWLTRAAIGDGDPADRAWRAAVDTCTAMATGGMYDQLGGGFARYSVDAHWIVPHFEKMLYDNALLLGVYARAAAEARRRGEPAELFERVVDRTVGWLTREMITDSGAFAASLDADSLDPDATEPGSGHGVEGAFYAWSPQQLIDALGADDGAWAAEAFAVSAAGTFEHGRSVLQRRRETDDARDSEDAGRLDRIAARLLAVREQRPRPARDDKVVAAWNGWLIASLVEAATLLDRPDWLAVAAHAAEAVLTTHLDPGTGELARISRDGVTGAAAVADDHAALAHGLLLLAAATGEDRWYDHAIALLIRLTDRFVDEDQHLHDAPADADVVVRRPRDPAENATPSGTTAALTAFRLAHRLSGDTHWADLADAMSRTMLPWLRQAPRAAGWALADAIVETSSDPVEVAVVGAPDAVAELSAIAHRDAPAGSVVVSRPLVGGAEATSTIPLLTGRLTVPTPDGALVYVCRAGVCGLPVSDADALARAWSAVPATPGGDQHRR